MSIDEKEYKTDGTDDFCKELVDAHWSYIEKLLLIQSVSDHQTKIIGFHYKTALSHGFKHGVEYMKELIKGEEKPTNKKYFTVENQRKQESLYPDRKDIFTDIGELEDMIDYRGYGHTYDCAFRLAFGDGKCECGGYTDNER